MQVPKIVREIAARADERHKADVDRAVSMAEAEVRALPEFRSLIDDLIHMAVDEAVREARHERSREIRRKANVYGRPGRVNVAQAGEVWEKIYQLPVAGKMLGMLTGAELPDAAAVERAEGDGSYVRARLLELLAGRVPENRTVKQSVPAAELNRLYQRAQRETKPVAARTIPRMTPSVPFVHAIRLDD